MNWEVGMDAVCIETLPDFEYGEVYKVAEVKIITPKDEVVIQTRYQTFVGKANHDQIILRFGNLWATAACFRPVVKRKTDISIFTQLLEPVKEDV